MPAYARHLLLLVACLIAFLQSHANAIDSLKTKEDVEKFALVFGDKFGYNAEIKLFPEKNDTPRGCERMPEDERKRMFGSNNFYKMDIDGNGKTDLVVDGPYSFIIMDMGGKFEVFRMVFPFIKAVHLPEGSTALLYSAEKDEIENGGRDIKTISTIDTLIYKIFGFTEYHEHPAQAKIKKIDFWERPGYGGDEYYLEISNTGNAASMDYVKVSYRLFDSLQLSALWNFLAYIDVRSLDSNYSILVTDQPTAFLTIYFEDGSLKRIRDYGFSGTMGLMTLYDKIFEWQKSDDWRTWNEAPEADAYLSNCPIVFNNYFSGTRDYWKKPSDNGQQLFVSGDQWCGMMVEDNHISLFPDHRFVYAILEQSDTSGCPWPQQNLFSLGNWSEAGDTITLNWDGPLTLKTARNHEEYKKYFIKEDAPQPIRIKNCKLTYSKGRDRLITMPVPLQNQYGIFKYQFDIFED